MRPKPLTPDRALRPKRFSAADNALRDALERLDPEGVAEALFDGADPDMPDGEGCVPLYWLFSALGAWHGEEAFGLAPSDVDERASACVDVLLSLGALPYPWHALPNAPEAQRLCLERENDCRDCPWSEDQDGEPTEDASCGRLSCREIIDGYDVSDKAPRACDTYYEWADRYGRTESLQYWRLLASGRDKLRRERLRRALMEEGAAGTSEKASSSPTL